MSESRDWRNSSGIGDRQNSGVGSFLDGKGKDFTSLVNKNNARSDKSSNRMNYNDDYEDLIRKDKGGSSLMRGIALSSLFLFLCFTVLATTLMISVGSGSLFFIGSGITMIAFFVSVMFWDTKNFLSNKEKLFGKGVSKGTVERGIGDNKGKHTGGGRGSREDYLEKEDTIHSSGERKMNQDVLSDDTREIDDNDIEDGKVDEERKNITEREDKTENIDRSDSRDDDRITGCIEENMNRSRKDARDINDELGKNDDKKNNENELEKDDIISGKNNSISNSRKTKGIVDNGALNRTLGDWNNGIVKDSNSVKY